MRSSQGLHARHAAEGRWLQVSRAGLQALHGLTQLQRLSLAGCQRLDNSSLAALPALVGLRALSLERSTGRHLSAEGGPSPACLTASLLCGAHGRSACPGILQELSPALAAGAHMQLLLASSAFQA